MHIPPQHCDSRAIIMPNANLQPCTLFFIGPSPNPWKVAIIFEELGIPYETEYMDFSVLKQEPFISVNPNGRTPAIEDPNTGITLWESGAIVDYLIDVSPVVCSLACTQNSILIHLPDL